MYKMYKEVHITNLFISRCFKVDLTIQLHHTIMDAEQMHPYFCMVFLCLRLQYGSMNR